MNITFRQLRLFLALAETGSVGGAARALHVTQPTASMALREVAQAVGLPLYELVSRRVHLTEAGEELARTARRVVDEWEAFEQRVDAMKGLTRGRLKVAVVSTAKYFVPRLLARFRTEHPGVEVRLEVTQNRDQLVAAMNGGEIDLAVGPLPAEGAGRDLRVQPLFDAQQVLVVRAGHPLARARRLAEIQHAGWVVTGPPTGPGDPMHLGFDRLGLATPPVVLACESFSTLVALLPSVDAIGIMPKGFFDQYASRLGVVKLPIDDPLPRVTLHAVWRADAPLTAPAAHLLDAMEQEARAVRAARV